MRIFDGEFRLEVDAVVGDIIMDAGGKAILWLGAAELIENTFGHRRGEFLG